MPSKNDCASNCEEDAGPVSMGTTIQYGVDNAEDATVVSERKKELGRRHLRLTIDMDNTG